MDRREFILGSAAVFATPFLISTVGCDAQQTILGLLTTLGPALSTLESIQGNTTIAQTIAQDFSAASAAVSAWKSGTPSQDVVNALGVLQNVINLIPVSGIDSDLIVLAAATITQIIEQLDPTAALGSSVISEQMPVSRAQVTPATVRKNKVHALIASGNVPKNKKTLKTQWNAEIALHPELSEAKIK